MKKIFAANVAISELFDAEPKHVKAIAVLKSLSVFVRVCSKLRDAFPRDEKAIVACELEVDLIRARLFAHPITDAELDDADKVAEVSRVRVL